MTKENYLEDIQKKIDLCDLYISQNPYPPSLKRVEYVLNNKCKARNIPFYLNAIYNELQQRLNVNLEDRKKYEYKVKKPFTLAEVTNTNNSGNFLLWILLHDKITQKRQKQVLITDERTIYTGLKNFLGIEKSYKETNKKLVWIDMVDLNDPPEVDDQNYYENHGIKPKYFNSVSEAIQEYRKLKNQVKTETIEVSDQFATDKIVTRCLKTHTIYLKAYINLKPYINKLIKLITLQKTIKPEDRDFNQPLLNWEYDHYTLEKANGDGIIRIIPNEEIADITKEMDYLSTKKIGTYVDRTNLNSFLEEMEELNELINDFDKNYYEDYLRQYNLYKGDYKSNNSVSNKRKKAFNNVNKKINFMFEVILQYLNQIISSSLQQYIAKYKKLQEIQNTYNSNKPEGIAVVTKLEDVETTDSYKKLLSRREEYQKVLNTYNQKLINAYNQDIAKYQKETELYKKKVEQNKKDLLQYKKDVESYNKKIAEYLKSYANVLAIENIDFVGVNVAFKDLLKRLKKELQTSLDILEAKYNKEKYLKQQLYDASQNYFEASDIKYNLFVFFMPDGIPYTTIMETLSSSFIYEDLLNILKEIIKSLNKKKLNENYINTTGKDLYNKNLEELRKLEDKKLELNTYLNKLENLPAVQNLYTLKDYRDNHQDAYTKEEYAKLNQGIYDYEQHISSLLNLIQSTKDQINDVINQYNIVSQKCYYYETQITPLIQKVSKKYDIYTQKEELENQLNILNSQIQEIAAIKQNQIKLNQSIMTTNSNYVKLRNECAPYFEYINDINILKKQGNSNEEIARIEDDLRAWQKGHWYKLDELEQYEKDLLQEQKDYLNNNNFLKSTIDFTNRKKNVEKQLAEINQKIALLEAPLVQQKISITDDGTKYLQGFIFSPNGLYKNLYIDTKKDNEWLILRLELKKLYSYYNITLPSGLIEEPKTSDELKQLYPIENLNGDIEIFEDNNKDCRCNWFIPMDYELFGPGIGLGNLKLTTKVYKTDKKGQKIPNYDESGKFTGYQILRRLMAVQNGYGFIDTGLRITLYYTGLPGPKPISVFIPGVGLDYGALLAGGYVALTLFNIFQLQKYPYLNDKPNGRFYWLQTGVIKDVYQTVMGKLPVEVTFKIYKKIPLTCGYPKKCGVLTPEEFSARGTCGLKQFFEETNDIFTAYDEKDFDIESFIKLIENIDLTDSDGLLDDLFSKANNPALNEMKEQISNITKKTSSDLLHNISELTRFADDKFEKVMNLYLKNFGKVGGRAAEIMQTKRQISEWGNTSLNLVQNTWNITDALGSVDLSRKGATQQAIGIINDLKKNLIDLVPPECQDTICETIRESKQDSIKDLGMSVNENTNINVDTLTNFVEQAWDSGIKDLKDKSSKVIDGICDVGSTILSAGTNFVNQFEWGSAFQYCPRRLADITKDINPRKQLSSAIAGSELTAIPESPDVFSQIGSMVGLEIIDNVMNALNNCVTRSITNHNINYSNLFPEGTRKYLEAANSVGDIANMAKGIGGYKMSLETLFHEANRSSIIDNFIDFNTDNISLGYLTDFLNERGISDIIDVDQLLKPTETIDSLKNTISKAVSNNNDIIDKINKGEILSMNDQYKQLVGDKLNEKTQLWANRWSDKVNTVTSIGLNAKGLVNTDFSKAWKDPHIVTNKLQNITNTMNSMFKKKQAEKKKENQEKNLALSESDLLKEMKNYIELRWQYLEKLTKQQYLNLKAVVEKLPVNI